MEVTKIMCLSDALNTTNHNILVLIEIYIEKMLADKYLCPIILLCFVI